MYDTTISNDNYNIYKINKIKYGGGEAKMYTVYASDGESGEKWRNKSTKDFQSYRLWHDESEGFETDGLSG